MKTWNPTPETYDPEEARIVSWFITGLSREAIRLTKKYKGLQEKELLILNDQVRKEEGGGGLGELVDTLAAKSDTYAEAEENIFMQEAFLVLTPLQKEVIVGIVLEGRTEQEVAREIGITRQAVHRLKERGLNRLRKKFILDRYHRQAEPYPGRTGLPYPKAGRCSHKLY